jgi:hypothetical protein
MPAHSSRVCPGIGRCIYCDASGVALSDEHVIPFALNGNLVIEDASCEDCRKLTSANEGIIARRML